ncbi:MAG: hypothetical protein WA964_08805 [Ilumatobacter sp.]|uniref:hypothetical protein n=1 Tax=Ilumatobacter sp. TaxID=1967498 RepID=UPI003C730010
MNNALKARPTAPVDASTIAPIDTSPVEQPPTLAGRYHRTPAIVAAEVVVAAGLAGTAYIHLEELSGKFAEVPYLGVGYALLSIACVVSIIMIATRNKLGWYLGGATALATFVGFVLTRTVGLPASTDDIGNWSESIGTWSLVAEGVVVLATAAMIALHFRTPGAATA